MTIPPGFEDSGKTCKLQRALYRLRQALQAWYSEINAYLQAQGLTKSTEEPKLYYSIRNGKYTLILLYVDDILLTGDDYPFIAKLNAHLSKRFQMTNLGDAQIYLGVEFYYTKDRIYLHQQRYIEKLLERFGMQDCNPFSVPMNPKLKLCKDTKTNPVDKLVYQSLVGGLLYATITRWDIQYAVSCVSRYMSNPQQAHLTAAKNILWYLRGTIDHGIFFPANDTGELSVFIDAEWAGETDSRRSTSGILYKLGSSPIAWSSKLQPTFRLSSTEAKYRVLSEATRNATHFRRLLDELKIGNSSPTPIFCDNLRTKYIELEHHYI